MRVFTRARLSLARTRLWGFRLGEGVKGLQDGCLGLTKDGRRVGWAVGLRFCNGENDHVQSKTQQTAGRCSNRRQSQIHAVSGCRAFAQQLLCVCARRRKKKQEVIASRLMLGMPGGIQAQAQYTGAPPAPTALFVQASDRGSPTRKPPSPFGLRAPPRCDGRLRRRRQPERLLGDLQLAELLDDDTGE